MAAGIVWLFAKYYLTVIDDNYERYVLESLLRILTDLRLFPLVPGAYSQLGVS